MYYAASIYQQAGFDELTAVWLSGFTALAQVAGIAASIFLVDKAGRRTLVLTSLGCVAVALAGLAMSFYLSRVTSGWVDVAMAGCDRQKSTIWDGITTYCYDCTSIPGCGFLDGSCVAGNITGPFDTNWTATTTTTIMSYDEEMNVDWQYHTCTGANNTSVDNPYGLLSVFFMVLYLLAFGIGMGGMPWTINSEIYPIQFRSLAVSLSTATNWVGNLVVSATFLTISSPQVLTAYGAFALYGIVSVFGWMWLWVRLPETKGKSLEEIEELFRRPTDALIAVNTNDDDDDDENDDNKDNDRDATVAEVD
jgi:SP family myo-inositol transporter-like MFS transporter 13